MTQLTVSLPPVLDDWINARLAEGEYLDAADYLRALVRRDRDAGDRRWLKAMIDEGLASGIDDREIDEVFDEILAEDPDLRG